ncbi:MAG: hypothetical protein EXR95_02565 [Gemmatimonadetes bacterium]|nr:hypothetical protein [Gemmatimonadota bacterium]
MGCRFGSASVAASLLAAAILSTASAHAQDGGNTLPLCPCVGPSRGTVMIAGGGALPSDIYRTFVKLAGGPSSRIVVIQTADHGDDFSPVWDGLEPFLLAGSRSARDSFCFRVRPPLARRPDTPLDDRRAGTGPFKRSAPKAPGEAS